MTNLGKMSARRVVGLARSIVSDHGQDALVLSDDEIDKYTGRRPDISSLFRTSDDIDRSVRESIGEDGERFFVDARERIKSTVHSLVTQERITEDLRTEDPRAAAMADVAEAVPECEQAKTSFMSGSD